jgi:hypothetical protein
MKAHTERATHVFIVGAGFSRYAGLPLQAGFTEALLASRKHKSADTKPLIDHVAAFINRAFDHKISAAARFWPDLEDVFTSIDLSSNTGHHLGVADPPSALRTTRRIMLAQMMWMLNDRYADAETRKDRDWKKLDQFFQRLPVNRSAFISLNWDTVIERGLQRSHGVGFFNYGCGAKSAGFPRSGDSVRIQTPGENERFARVVKIHGSVNWLYCDNCRQLYWFSPESAREVAIQLLSPAEAHQVGFAVSGCGKWNCKRCRTVPLTTRLATFSYLKALDFPMFDRSWQTAERLLRGADKWVFIGYSLPSADYEFKHLLKRVQLARLKPPEFVVITGGRHTGDTYKNYQRFFGRAIKRKSNFFDRGISRRSISAAIA